MNRSAVTLCFLLACRLSALDYPRRYALPHFRMEQKLNRLEPLIPVAIDRSLQATIEHVSDEHLYGFALFTNDILDSLYPLANTEERLSKTVRRYNLEVDPKHGLATTANNLRWSYGDWGIDGVGKEHFEEINSLLTEIHCEVIEKFWDNNDGADAIFDSLWSIVVDGFTKSNKDTIANEHGISDITYLMVGDFDDFYERRLNRPEIALAYEQFDPDA